LSFPPKGTTWRSFAIVAIAAVVVAVLVRLVVPEDHAEAARGLAIAVAVVVVVVLGFAAILWEQTRIPVVEHSEGVIESEQSPAPSVVRTTGPVIASMTFTLLVFTGPSMSSTWAVSSRPIVSDAPQSQTAATRPPVVFR